MITYISKICIIRISLFKESIYIYNFFLSLKLQPSPPPKKKKVDILQPRGSGWSQQKKKRLQGLPEDTLGGLSSRHLDMMAWDCHVSWSPSVLGNCGVFSCLDFQLQDLFPGIERLCNLQISSGPTNADLHLGGLHRGNRRYWNCSHLRCQVSGDETAARPKKRWLDIRIYIYTIYIQYIYILIYLL